MLHQRFSCRVTSSSIWATSIFVELALVNEDTLLWLEDHRVGHPYGDGPFAPDDTFSTTNSWVLCGMPGQVTLTDWMPDRQKLWRACAPWTEELMTLFKCVRDELMSQCFALSPDGEVQERQRNQALVNEDTLLWLEDHRVGHPYGDGPFAPDDAFSTTHSWVLCGMPGQVTLTDWMPDRQKLWRACAPWTEGLMTLFTCVRDELWVLKKSL